MAKFEVYIPASDSNGFNVTLKVGADNWMAALKAGMQKLGEQGSVSQNVMVDIQEDNSVHVTDTASGRVFHIRELTEAEASKALVKKPTQSLPAVPANMAPPPPPAPSAPAPAPATFAERSLAATEIGPARVIEPVTQPPVADTEPPFKSSDTQPGVPTFDSNKTVLNIAPPPAPSKPASPPTPIVTPAAQPLKHTTGQIQLKDVEEIEEPVKPTASNIGRPKTKPVPAVSSTSRSQAEDMLSDIFLRVAELNSKTDVNEAMEFILDLAMEKVPCESGAVLRADGATGDLTFLTARGPKAKELLKSKIVVPAGSGIAGFCSAEGVAVALSDVKKDGRFYADVGEQVEYETKSILCAPMMTHGMSFGCVQLINRKNSPTWAEHETGVLTYLAHQAALFLNRKLLE